MLGPESPEWGWRVFPAAGPPGAQACDLGEAVFIPSIMLKHNSELFLDDKKISEVSQILNTKIHILDNPDDIINTLIGISKSQEFLDYA